MRGIVSLVWQTQKRGHMRENGVFPLKRNPFGPFGFALAQEARSCARLALASQ
jgi:hypothetical protein